VLRILDRLEEWLVASLMAAATVVIFVAVVHRYASALPIPGLQDWLLRINLSWAQELCIYLFIWMAKFGAAYGVRTGIHVGVDVLINRLPARVRAKFIVFGLLAGALFTGIIGTLGATFVWDGKSAAGTPMTEGTYTLRVTAKDSQGTVAHGSSLMEFEVVELVAPRS